MPTEKRLIQSAKLFTFIASALSIQQYSKNDNAFQNQAYTTRQGEKIISKSPDVNAVTKNNLSIWNHILNFFNIGKIKKL